MKTRIQQILDKTKIEVDFHAKGIEAYTGMPGGEEFLRYHENMFLLHTGATQVLIKLLSEN